MPCWSETHEPDCMRPVPAVPGNRDMRADLQDWDGKGPEFVGAWPVTVQMRAASSAPLGQTRTLRVSAGGTGSPQWPWARSVALRKVMDKETTPPVN